MGKVLAVTSGKGGVGKSTFSIGMGFAFASMGKKVLLVDMDEGLRCLDLLLKIDKTAVFDLSDILNGGEIENAVYPTPLWENLFLIPAPLKAGMIDAFEFAKFADSAKESYDIVIFDFPAGIDFTLYASLPKESLFITVAVPDPISIRDAAAVSQQLYSMNLNSRLVINRFVYKQSRKYKVKNIDEIIDKSSLRLLGLVPESDEMRLFSLSHKLKKRGKAALAYKRIARRIDGENILLPKLKKI
ncbi:MAG: AAA family ATPase [Clostridia bacterium]|nr:AAA family ATPase [Clostridia bacterium]